MFRHLPTQFRFLTPSFSVQPFPRAKSGFTLMEILVAVSIIAILSTVGFTVYTQGQKLARDAKRKADLMQIRGALLLYYQDNKRFPTTSTTNALTSLSSTSASSSNPYWLADNNGASSIAFNQSYIDPMPADPINNATYNYVYYSFGNSNSWGACTDNQYFRIHATLENTDDPQAYKFKPVNPCNVGGAGTALNGYDNTYMIIERMR